MNVQSLQMFAENLIEKGFVFETRAAKVCKNGREKIVEVGDTSAVSTDDPILEDSVNHYLELIRQNKFSWLLFDASLVQIWYRCRADQVTAHRYCYTQSAFCHLAI
jgi:hypothetical protein